MIIYEHIRKDTGEVFYIGTGDRIVDAYRTLHKPESWYQVVKQTNYEVKVVDTHIPKDFIKQRLTDYKRAYGYSLPTHQEG